MNNTDILAMILMLVDLHGCVPPGSGTPFDQETHSRAIAALQWGSLPTVETKAEAEKIITEVLAMDSSRKSHLTLVQDGIRSGKPASLAYAYQIYTRQEFHADLAAFIEATGTVWGEEGEIFKGSVNAIVEKASVFHGPFGSTNENLLRLETGETLVWKTGTVLFNPGDIVCLTYCRIKEHTYDGRLERHVTAVTHCKFAV